VNSIAIEKDPDVRNTYASDASGLYSVPEGVARPTSTDEVADLLRYADKDRVAVTAAGSQTSTTGASIADSGLILSLRGMQRIIDIDPAAATLRVQAGAILGDVKRAAAAQGLLLAPDPTSENECTVGGAVACNASGARTFRYGATRRHVRAVTAVLASGDVIELRRNVLEKNTAGYALAQDPVDWFIGSEGTLGVITEVEFALMPLPERVIGLEVPFATESDALEFVVAVRESTSVSARCVEYFDDRATVIARNDEHRAVPPAGQTMVYVEQEMVQDGGDAEFSAMLDAWQALAEKYAALADDVRVFDGAEALATARHFRHSVPATMNERGGKYRAAGGRKVSTDWAVPHRALRQAISTSRGMASEAGIEPPVTYGHAGNGHPHQNYIARDATELAVINDVIEQTLHTVLAMSGTVAAEHGIGKLKRHWLRLQMTPMQLGVMRAVKLELDPHGILAPGNIF
jgi:FAD/FMN-containing dehydrogenase